MQSSANAPAVIKHDAQPLRDVVAYENEEEKQLSLAVFAHPAIKHMDVPDANIALAKAVGTWCFMLGIKKDQLPTETDLDLINGWIRRTYGFVSVQEIQLAIELSLSGALRLDTTSTFGNTLSIQYISTILNAYLDYRHRKLKKINEQSAKMIYQNALPAPAPTPNEEVELMREMISNEYHRYKKTGQVLDLHNYIWDYLKRTKKIIVDRGTLAAAKQEGVKKMQALLLADPKKENLQSVPTIIEREMERRNRLNPEEGERYYARQYLIKLFFDARNLDAILRMVKPTDFEPKTQSNEKNPADAHAA